MIVAPGCDGCGDCVASCPVDAIAIVDGAAVIDEGCIGCGSCIDACDRGLILTASEDLVGEGVLIVGECVGGRPTDGTMATVGLASTMGCPGTTSLVLLETDGRGGHEDAIGMVDSLHVIAMDGDPSDVRPLRDAVTALIRDRRPLVVLFPTSSTSRAIAPGIAASLRVGLTADCTSVGMDGRRLMQTRPAFGGEVMATIESSRAPQMAIVRALDDPPQRDGGTVVTRERVTASGRMRTISQESLGTMFSLTDADIVISVGNGMSDRGIELANRLAKMVDGSLACSRAVVESGRLDRSFQVGQTGSHVSPKLYIALGVSGAVQHRVGISRRSRVVAVNIDPDAPIHDIADLSLIVDAEELLNDTLEAMCDADP